MKAVLGINIDVRTLTEIDEISGKTDLMCVVKTQFDAELPESSCCYNCGGTKPVAAKQRFAPRSARNRSPNNEWKRPYYRRAIQGFRVKQSISKLT